ncbi:hypothetical protein Tco_0273832 [Tanacetum coccineum]
MNNKLTQFSTKSPPSTRQWVLKSVSPEQLITVANVIDAAKIHKRVGAHKSKYHDAKTISLGLGDTAQRVPKVISSSMAKGLQGAQDWAWKKKT